MAIKRKTTKAQPIKIIPPFLSEELKTSDNLKEWLEREETIGYLHFTKGVTDTLNRPYLTIRNYVFTQQTFFDCLFKSAQISDVRFENCDLSNIQLAESSLHRVEFISCKLLGTNLSETTLSHVMMHDCNAQYINLSMSKLTQVRFSQCDFQHSNFNNNRLTSVAFDTCQFNEADFSQTPLKGIDFRTCQIERLALGFQDIRGAIVGYSQVMDLIPLLGVIVRE